MAIGGLAVLMVSFDYSWFAAGVGGIIRDFKGNLVFAFANSVVAHQRAGTSS